MSAHLSTRTVMAAIERELPSHAVPTQVCFNKDSALEIRWIDLAGHRMIEPFFFQTVAAVRRAVPKAEEFATHEDALLDRGNSFPGLKPSGVIFHVGRCGSTLLSNVLRLAAGAVVLSEVPIFDALCRPPVQWCPPSDWAASRIRLLDSTIRTFGFSQELRPRVVVKQTSLGIFDMSLLRAAWPDVPAIILIRDPIEVLMSFLQKPAPFLLRRTSPDLLVPFGWEKSAVEGMTLVEYYSRHLARLLEYVLESLPSHWKVVDYGSLSPTNIYRIADSFGLEMPQRDSGDVSAIMSQYSKTAVDPKRFTGDADDKQRSATGLVREAAERWAVRPYLALRNRASVEFSPDPTRLCEAVGNVRQTAMADDAGIPALF